LFGTSVASAGDVDGDGYADVLVGSGAWAVRSPEDPSLLVLSVRTGKILFAVGQGLEVDRFGNRSVCGPGDLNSDGKPDFVLVAWRPTLPAGDYFVTAYSGADASELWECPLHRFRGIEGISLVALPDVDGDHVPDLAVGMTNPFDKVHPGRVALISGRSGCLITEFSEPLEQWRWCGSIGSAGDLDGDRITDLVIPVEVSDRSRFTGECAFDVLSGADLHRIRRFELNGYFEAHCDGLGDIDGDGIPDLLVTGTEMTSSVRARTHAQVLSGRDGSLLSRFSDSESSWPHADARTIGDVDGDGRQDFALSNIYYAGDQSGVRVLSGRDGTPIRWIPAPNDGFEPRSLGYAVAGAGDVDRDGIPDLVVGTAEPRGDEEGFVDVYSGRTAELLRRWSRADLRTSDSRRNR
jgi:hypothetical protein